MVEFNISHTTHELNNNNHINLITDNASHSMAPHNVVRIIFTDAALCGSIVVMTPYHNTLIRYNSMLQHITTRDQLCSSKQGTKC